MTNDWHNAHLQEHKYEWAEHHYVPYLRCTGCETPIRMLPPELATRVYANHMHELDFASLLRMCPKCKQVAAATRDALAAAASATDSDNGNGNGNGNGARKRAADAPAVSPEDTPPAMTDGVNQDAADAPRAAAG